MATITESSSHGFNTLGTGQHKNNRWICGLKWVEIICTTVSGKISGRVVTYRIFCFFIRHSVSKRITLWFYCFSCLKLCVSVETSLNMSGKTLACSTFLHVKQLAFFENKLTWLDFQFVNLSKSQCFCTFRIFNVKLSRFWVKAVYLSRVPFKVWRKLSFTFSSLVQSSYSLRTTQVMLLLLSQATTRHRTAKHL